MHLAFMRAINLGAHNPIKMSVLKELFASQGAHNVRTYLQSGNVLFQCAPQEVSGVVRGVEAKLEELLGNAVPITTRPLAVMKQWIESEPYASWEIRSDDKRYVTFLYHDPQHQLTFPLTSQRGDIVAFELREREVLSVSRRVEGKYGFPNAFIEKELGVVATSRRWSTVEKFIAKHGNI